MGRPRETGKPNPEQRIQHFSHEHPLELFNIQERPLHFAACSGCKVPPSAMVYGCKLCNYILHISCSKMPQLIRHPADPNHSLTLLLQPAYPGGKFRCDACGVEGNGFCYHCTTCGLDIHIHCATKPLSVNHQTHPHPLNLTFSPPYLDKSFSCDICHNHGSDHWVYRCNGCGFDAHLNCATSKAPPSSSVHQHQTQSPSPQPQYNHQHQTRSPSPQPQYNLQHQTRSPLPQPQYNHQHQTPSPLPPPQYNHQHQTRSPLLPPQYNQQQNRSPLPPPQYNHQHQTRSRLPPPQYNPFPAANHQYPQPTVLGAPQQASQNFLQGFIDQQKQLQNTMLQQIMGAAPAFGQGFMQSMNGGNIGSAGAVQQVTQSVLQNMMGGDDGGIVAGVASSIVEGLLDLN